MNSQLSPLINGNPPVGLHIDLDAASYHALPYASASRLKDLMRSPAHAQAAMMTAKKSPALIFGTAFHTAVLEPEKLDSLFAIADQCGGMTGKGSRCNNAGGICRDGKWFCKIHDPEKGTQPTDTREPFDQADLDSVLLMAQAVRNHRAACEILEARSHTEVSAVWDDPATGVRCKLRADMICDGLDCIGDLKSTLDASPAGFLSAVMKFRYDIQAGHYVRGICATHRLIPEFRLIAVEKKPPFAVAVYRFGEESLIRALDDLDTLLPKWKRCQESDDWREAYGVDIREISFPEWFVKRQDAVREAAMSVAADAG